MEIQKKKAMRNFVFILSIFFACWNIVAFLYRKLSANDYYWHIKVGEWIEQNGSVPKTAIFSWYGEANQLKWVAHEWLYEWGIYHLHGRIGEYGMEWFVILLCGGLYFLNMMRLTKKNNVWLFFLSFVWLYLMAYYAMPRPHILLFFFLTTTLIILDQYRKKRGKSIYLLVPLGIVWTNAHGGSSNLLYVLILFYLLADLRHWGIFKQTVWQKKERITLFVVMILSVLAICVNPNGKDMLLYPYTNMGDEVMKTNITEWRHLGISGIFDWVTIGYLVIGAVIVYKSRKEITLIEIMLLTSFAYLSYSSVRFVMMYVIVSFPIYLRYLPSIDEEVFERMKKPLYQKMAVLWLILLVGSQAYYMTDTIKKTLKHHTETEDVLSEKIIEQIKEYKPKKLYNTWSKGGHLIYHDIPVFVDGRADIYSRHNMTDYQTLQKWEKGSETLLKKYDFDLMQVLVDSRLYENLLKQKDYELVYKEKEVALFKPKK